MTTRIELLEDVVGENDAGEVCHPFKGQRGDKAGFYSFTFETDNTTFSPITEVDLRNRIEQGDFNEKGRVRPPLQVHCE